MFSASPKNRSDAIVGGKSKNNLLTRYQMVTGKSDSLAPHDLHISISNLHFCDKTKFALVETILEQLIYK